MSVALAELLLELAASQVFPALAVEMGGAALRHAARSSAKRHPRRPSGAGGLPRPLRLLEAVTVLSDIPGRARLAVAGVRDDPRHGARLAERLRALRGVQSVQANRLTGSLLVRYDPDRLTLDQIRATLEGRDQPLARRGARSERDDVRQLTLVSC